MIKTAPVWKLFKNKQCTKTPRNIYEIENLTVLIESFMYVIIWKYEIKPGVEEEFEQAYGPRGVWYDFFQKGDGYRKTQLLKDRERANCYVTLDHWESKKSI